MFFCIYILKPIVVVGGGLEEHEGNMERTSEKCVGGFRFEGLYL